MLERGEDIDKALPTPPIPRGQLEFKLSELVFNIYRNANTAQFVP